MLLRIALLLEASSSLWNAGCWVVPELQVHEGTLHPLDGRLAAGRLRTCLCLTAVTMDTGNRLLASCESQGQQVVINLLWVQAACPFCSCMLARARMALEDKWIEALILQLLLSRFIC